MDQISTSAPAIVATRAGMQLTFNNEFSRSTLADGATAPWNTTFFGCLRNLITTPEQSEAELDQDDARQSSF